MNSPRLLRRCLLAALSAVLAASAFTAAPAHAAPEAADATVFSDTFDGAAGSAVDSSKWQIETGDNVNNHERQYYTSGNKNAALDGQGHLVITARRENPANYQCWYGTCQYTSARLNTSGKFTAQYGHVEARMKIPRGQGMWPAFWMLGNDIGQVGWPNSGEIDVMENVGFEPSTVHGTIHGPGYSGSGGIGAGYSLPNGQAFADAFHTFAVDWAPDSITWSVDGNVYQRRTPADLGGKAWAFNKPFFLILNLAVGGYWPGDPDGSTAFPQQLVVDSVTVTTGNASGGTGSPITGLAGKCVDVAGANPANGTAVQLYDCNGTAAQNWTVGSDGTVRALGKCLDVVGNGTADGSKVQLWDCTGGPNQKWTVTGARDIVNPQANKCLDVTDNDSTNGTRLQIWSCSGGANQKWTVG
ncbi:family 16 glycosylhydrolase [Streptomyces sp. NPDC093228]|uniref:RICIN domain-containing protein n=1 Tax=unclassified Streptomyces TaxID=2593676 RepID=UPI000740F757|nr:MULTISPECIES: family 16 glycosylhydrolase [unclassified Streptomyces]KUJ38676.1 1,3-beta-glucanase [Streptomyces sp. NRRL F-5122]MDX3258168.1 family 16 glycosylhydrolase [Streptomyces sp. MI02-2A]REE58430.1 ricin-type beta-trefoil lectin protein [Streptomyces sp. 3212.3]